MVLKTRLTEVRTRAKRSQILPKLRLNSTAYMREAGVLAMVYGVDITGMGEALLKQARTCVAAACRQRSELLAHDARDLHERPRDRPGWSRQRLAHPPLGRRVVGAMASPR